MDKRLEKLEKVVAIIPYGRGGTYFFQSLLDNHPNVLTIPISYIMMYYVVFWDQCQDMGLNTNKIIELFIRKHDMLFSVNGTSDYFPGRKTGIESNLHRMGSNMNQCLEVDKGLFRKYLIQLIGSEEQISRKNFFKAIHLAYYLALGKSFENIKGEPIIVFQHHTHEKEPRIKFLEDFTNAFIINNIRHPIQSLGSSIKWYINRKESLNIDSLLWVLHELLYNADLANDKYKHNYIGVKLEDLHTKSRKTMEKVCDFIGLDWNETLLESTFNGLTWWSYYNNKPFSGFNENIIQKKHKDIFNTFDLFRLEALFSKRNSKWNYSPITEWIGYDYLKKMLEHPFKFEKFLPENERNWESRELVKNKMLDYWEKMYFSKECEFIEVLKVD